LLDEEIEQVKQEVQQTREQVRELQQRYQMLSSALTNEQILGRLDELKIKVCW
jgi:prefoldin subunit 5